MALFASFSMLLVRKPLLHEVSYAPVEYEQVVSSAEIRKSEVYKGEMVNTMDMTGTRDSSKIVEVTSSVLQTN